MMSQIERKQKELSIIVPILNEAQQLPDFLQNLRTQRDVSFDVILCDGGSTDGSLEWLQFQAGVSVLVAAPGRGRQLNRGIAVARGQWLLLLHADSRFYDELALRHGLDWLRRTGNVQVAGHFALSFRDMGEQSAGAYDFYQRKARLGRAETIHGDQGFLLHRQLAQRLGGLREDLPAMEDTDYAERLRQVGQWQLLPAEISTSARRFVAEGLWQRQLLGALLMCFRQIGWDEFFVQAPAVYRQQSRTDRLQLAPFFDLISELLKKRPFSERWRLWLATGNYVRGHAWQLLFAVDAWRARRQGRGLAATATPWLSFGEPIFDLLTDHPGGRFVTALLVRIWFSGMRVWLRRQQL